MASSLNALLGELGSRLRFQTATHTHPPNQRVHEGRGQWDKQTGESRGLNHCTRHQTIPHPSIVGISTTTARLTHRKHDGQFGFRVAVHMLTQEYRPYCPYRINT